MITINWNNDRLNALDFKNVVILEQINPICALLPVGTMTVDIIDSTMNVFNVEWLDDYVKSKAQIHVKNGSTPLGVFYLDSYEFAGSGIVKMKCVDLIGVFDKIKWGGDTVSKEPLSEVVDGILQFTDYRDSVVIDSYFSGITVTDSPFPSYFPPQTVRESLQRLGFWSGGGVNNSGGIHRKSPIAILKCDRSNGKLKFYKASETPKVIPLERILNAPVITNNAKPNGVVINYEWYNTVFEELVTIVTNEELVDELQIILDDAPYQKDLYSLEFEQGNVEMFYKSATNLILKGNCEKFSLTGYTYTSPIRINVISVDTSEDGEYKEAGIGTADFEATGIGSMADCVSIAKKVFAYYEMPYRIELRNVVLQGEEAGDLVEFTTKEGVTLHGIIEELEINATGGMVGNLVLMGVRV